MNNLNFFSYVYRIATNAIDTNTVENNDMQMFKPW